MNRSKYSHSARAAHNEVSEERPWSCGLCDYAAARKGTLERHVLIHSNKMTVRNPYFCTGCNQHYSRVHTVRDHIKTSAIRNPQSKCAKEGKVGGLSEEQKRVSEHQKDYDIL